MSITSFLAAQILLTTLVWAQNISLPEPPQVRAKNHVASLTLRAVNENGRDAFAYNGASVAPVIRASPGDVLKITYINDLPPKSPESCAISPCMDMTNLHFHGLTVSPHARQDDVLGMMAKPGQVLHYCGQEFRAIIRPDFSGTTLIPMARVIGRYWTECLEPSSSREWSGTSPK